MTPPFKISPNATLRGAALGAEVRQTYPLSRNDEQALRLAVKDSLTNLKAKRVSSRRSKSRRASRSPISG